MKQTSSEKAKKSNNADDNSVRYKLNMMYFNNLAKSNKTPKKQNAHIQDDIEIRYKFPPSPAKSKIEKKTKPKPPKIKVNFWSNKPSTKTVRLNKPEDIMKRDDNRRHTVGGNEVTKLKSPVKVRKQVSFLPSPLFSDNHIPMVTVPDDLTIQFNEEEANDLGEDLNFESSSKQNSTQTSPKVKRTRSDAADPKSQSENELEFFSKYIVQKLRRMETNQRIYSENLINTVLMLGQLGKLNGKSKILEP